VSAGYCQKALVDESGIIRAQMGTHNGWKWSQCVGCLVWYHPITVTITTVFTLGYYRLKCTVRYLITLKIHYMRPEMIYIIKWLYFVFLYLVENAPDLEECSFGIHLKTTAFWDAAACSLIEGANLII
jgi:hypothetical protein